MKFGLWIGNREILIWILTSIAIILIGFYMYQIEILRMSSSICIRLFNKEVVDYIYNMLAKILREAKVSYINDMNRSITECYSVALPG